MGDSTQAQIFFRIPDCFGNFQTYLGKKGCLICFFHLYHKPFERIVSGHFRPFLDLYMPPLRPVNRQHLGVIYTP